MLTRSRSSIRFETPTPFEVKPAYPSAILSVTGDTTASSHSSDNSKPLRRSSSSNILLLPADSPKKAVKSQLIRAHSKKQPDTEKKRQELKRRARAIPLMKKTPVTPHQLAILEAVFYEITPYPTQSWTAILSLLLDRNYDSVKNWFNNQREKVKAQNLENPDYDLPNMVEMIHFDDDGHTLKLRPCALRMATGEEWTDDFFEAVIMVYNLKPRVPTHGRGAALAST